MSVYQPCSGAYPGDARGAPDTPFGLKISIHLTLIPKEGILLLLVISPFLVYEAAAGGMFGG